MEFEPSSVTSSEPSGATVTHRASPDVPVVDHEAGHEILIFAAGMSGLMQRHADQFVAHANRPVPGAMFAAKISP